MNIHLARDGSALGIFTADEVRAGLESGRFRRDDLAWREGMPAWTALSTWPEFANLGDIGAAAPDVPVGPAMPAWERGASFANFFATIRDVAVDPIRTFDSLPRDGVAKPLSYNYLAALPGWICGSLAYGLLFTLVGVAAFMGGGAEAEKLGREFGQLGPLAGAFFIALAFACFFVLMPLVHFVGAGITHLLLLPWSPKGGYLMTYRSTAYAQGAFLPFVLVPCLNYVAGPWSAVASVIALSRVHRIEWWKVVISVVVIPCGCLCCAYVGLFMSLLGK